MQDIRNWASCHIDSVQQFVVITFSDKCLMSFFCFTLTNNGTAYQTLYSIFVSMTRSTLRCSNNGIIYEIIALYAEICQESAGGESWNHVHFFSNANSHLLLLFSFTLFCLCFVCNQLSVDDPLKLISIRHLDDVFCSPFCL